MKRDGFLSKAAILVIEIEEVFEEIVASGFITLSRFVRICLFSSKF